MARASPGVRVAKPKFKGIEDVASKPMIKINIVVRILDYPTLELGFLIGIIMIRFGNYTIATRRFLQHPSILRLQHTRKLDCGQTWRRIS